MSDKVALVRLRAQNDQYDAAMKKSRGETEALGTTAKKTSGGLGSMKTAMAGLVVGVGLHKVIGEYEQAQKVGAQTTAVIKSTGNAAQVSAAQQDKMVQSLSNLSAIDDEVIAQGANVLRTFTNIQGADTFEGALKAATDLSAAMGQDLQSSIVLVGKALNDPIHGLQFLQKVGVSFTADQKEQIKALQASGDAMGAQKLILGELTREFGGAAEANRTDSAAMKVAFDNAAESLGASLAPALSLAAGGAEKASTAFQGLPQPLQAAAVGGIALALVGPRIAEGWSNATDAISASRTALSGSVDDFGYAKTAALGAAVGIGSYNAAYKVLESLGSVHVDMATLAADLQNIALAAKNGADAPLDALITDAGFKNMKGVADSLDTLDRSADSTWKKLREGRYLLNGVVEHIDANKIDNKIHAIDDALAQLAKTSPEDARAAFDALTQSLYANGASADQIARRFPKATDALRVMAGSSRDAGHASKDAKGGVDEMTGSIDKQKTSVVAAKDVIGDYIGEIKGLSDVRQASADADAAVVSAEQAREDAQRTARENNAAAAQQLASAESQLSDSREAAAKAGQEVVAAEADLAKKREEATGNSDAARAAQEKYNQAVTTAAQKDQDAARAVLALDAARKGYQKTLAGLADDAADAAARNERQQIAIDQARKNVADVNADPTKSADERRLAQLDLEQAIRDQRDTLDAANAAQETYNRNQAAGAEGSDAYVAANDNVTAALASQSDAHKAVAAAADERSQVQVAANAAVATAEQNLADKIDARNKADAATVAAAEGVSAANAHVAQVAADGQKQVEDATRKVTDAALAAVWAHDALLVKLGLGGEAAKLTASELRTLAGTLSPTDPLRQNLLDTATALENIAKVWQVTIKVGVTDAGGAVVAAGMNILAAVFPTRAKGGPVQKGQPYLVGEEGPELIIPDGNGQVLTAAKTKAAASALHGSTKPAPHKGSDPAPTVATAATAAATATAVAYRQAQEAVRAANEEHRRMGAEEYQKWVAALTALFKKGHGGKGEDGIGLAGHKGSGPGGTVGRLPSSVEGDSMYAAMHDWGLTHAPVGMEGMRPRGSYDGNWTRGMGGLTIDYDRLARLIADSGTQVGPNYIDASGLTAAQATTAVTTDLVAKVNRRGRR